MHRQARDSILQNSFLYSSVRVTPAPSHESLDSIPSVSEVSSMELGVSEAIWESKWMHFHEITKVWYCFSLVVRWRYSFLKQCQNSRLVYFVVVVILPSGKMLFGVSRKSLIGVLKCIIRNFFSTKAKSINLIAFATLDNESLQNMVCC